MSSLERAVLLTAKLYEKCSEWIDAMRDYLIISPCRNEEKFVQKTLDSMVSQSILPAKWIIVDDGSTDGTPAILKEYEEKYDFIQVVTRDNRGHRSVGPGVIEAFYAGYETVDTDDYDYICKLDLDLILPQKYFEGLMIRMEAEPRIGTASGKPYYYGSGGQLISEGCGDETSIGASKFYKRECFKQIGGFVRQVMWDGIDTHSCRMKGWIPCSWDDEELRFIHLRPMGSSQKGIITGRIRHGYGQYFMGASFLYTTVAAMYRTTKRPFIIGGIAMWYGYVKSWLLGNEQHGTKEFRKFLRRYQWQCLLKGKKTATMKLNDQQKSVWRG